MRHHVRGISGVWAVTPGHRMYALYTRFNACTVYMDWLVVCVVCHPTVLLSRLDLLGIRRKAIVALLRISACRV